MVPFGIYGYGPFDFQRLPIKSRLSKGFRSIKNFLSNGNSFSIFPPTKNSSVLHSTVLKSHKQNPLGTATTTESEIPPKTLFFQVSCAEQMEAKSFPMYVPSWQRRILRQDKLLLFGQRGFKRKTRQHFPLHIKRSFRSRLAVEGGLTLKLSELMNICIYFSMYVQSGLVLVPCGKTHVKVQRSTFNISHSTLQAELCDTTSEREREHRCLGLDRRSAINFSWFSPASSLRGLTIAVVGCEFFLV